MITERDKVLIASGDMELCVTCEEHTTRHKSGVCTTCRTVPCQYCDKTVTLLLLKSKAVCFDCRKVANRKKIEEDQWLADRNCE